MASGKIALAASMISLAQKKDTISHNLANMNSPAFKGKVGSFASYLRSADRANPSKHFHMPVFFETPNFTQGDVVNTNNRLDVAINGKGFFKVECANGDIAYTRSGSFKTSNQGFLATPTGEYVLQENGDRIALTAKDINSLIISNKGVVKTQDMETGQTQTLGVLALVNFVQGREASGETTDKDISNMAAPTGEGRYKMPTVEGAKETPAYQATITQNALERSNVDGAKELVQMLMVQRTFEACGNTMKTVGKAKQAFMNIAKQG